MRIDMSLPILPPKEIGVCPTCSALLLVDPTEWYEDDDGNLHISDFTVGCSTEPEPDEIAAWNKWMDFHAVEERMPYVYWLPIEEKVKRWLETVEVVDSAADRRKLERWNTQARAV